MEKQRVTKIIILSGIALVCLILLAAGLNKILYVPVNIPINTETTIVPLGRLPTMTIQSNEAIYYLLFILLLIAFLSLFLTSEGRKRLGLASIIVILLIIAAYLIGLRRETPAVLREETSSATNEYQSEFIPTTLPLIQSENLEPETPSWVVTLAGIGLAVLLTVGIAQVVWYLSHKPAKPTTLQAITDEATQTIEALEAGEDFEDAIMRCYAKMSHIINHDRGLMREAAMTPREFERSLSKLGFPNKPVHDLTYLFEQVRYGHIAQPKEGIQLAIDSLNAIVAFCQPRFVVSGNE